MFNAGKNNDAGTTMPIGNGFIGYECLTPSKLGVAAYLNNHMYFEAANCSAVMSISLS